MDVNHFDAFVISLDRAVPRRGALIGALGMGLTALLTRSGGDSSGAKRRKKKCKGGKKKCGKTCRDLQTDPLNCGSCGNRCDVGKECHDGTCSCPEEETECGGACCDIGFACIDGQCSFK
jgi:hypothetical protein